MYSLELKLKILKHVSKYGINSAIDAFEVKKSSIYSWQNKLLVGNDNHSVLQNKSTKPLNCRTRVGLWDYRIEEYIQQLRITHPGLTKEKVWKLLCNYNQEVTRQYSIDQVNNPPPISKLPSIATIGRIIADLKYNRQIPDWSRKLSFYANTSSFRIRVKKKVKKQRPIKTEFKLPGQRLQIDTVVILKQGIRRYIINAVDVYSRLSFSYTYKSISSNSAKDFLIKMRQVFPFITQKTQVQNDNGSEFMKNFQEYLKQQAIKQYWNYPHSPKMNTWVERYNGSMQFEFVYRNMDSLFKQDITEFNTKLMHHLVWYNTERPHLSLDLKSPLEFVLSNNQFSKMWWTRTNA
jgi:transposase InsO family protein